MTSPSPESAARARDAACRLAPSNWSKALKAASDIPLPWYRCQALAHVAASASAPGDFKRAIDAAILACEAAGEPYKVVAVSAWPIAALMKSGHTSRATALASRMAGLAPTVSPDASRAEALVLLYQAVFPVADRLCTRLADELLSLAARGHWRAKRAIRDVALLIASQNPRRALEYVDRFPAGVPTASLREEIEAGRGRAPRLFV